jgi:microcystin-dependent protein
MIRLFTKNATGVAPDGRWFAGDINALQDAVAAALDLAQTIGTGVLQIGETGLQLLRYGVGEARLTGALRTDGIIRALGGLYAGAFTTTQRDAIPAGFAPYGLQILNTTTNRYEWNKGSDAVRNWQPISEGAGSLVDTLGNIPSVGTVPIGTVFFATDQVVDYVSNGAAWLRKSIPAGATLNWFKPDAAAPAGWVKYDGTNLPSSTGIYAAIYAHLGNTLVTPNTKGKVIVGQDTGDVDFDVIAETRGAKTHTLISGEIPAHSHIVTRDVFSLTPGGTAYSIGPGGPTADTSTLNTGGGAAHNNIQPSIVGLKIAKL